MAHGKRELGVLASQLAEALDDLALAVENYRISKCSDSLVNQSIQVTQDAILKAQKESLK